ncbi:MAG: hypothetical protein PUC65_03405 [Clostridiales bacterium]|nr:hypothetical protein [Clostridiales bacterium]
MTENSLKITYKIYFEAEDIKESRIISSRSFVKNFFENCGSVYFQNVEIDDECDLEDYFLRLYVDRVIEEEECSSPEDAENFITDMAEFLDKLAESQSFMQMEGSFSLEYKGKKESYKFNSEEGCDYCDFAEA